MCCVKINVMRDEYRLQFLCYMIQEHIITMSIWNSKCVNSNHALFVTILLCWIIETILQNGQTSLLWRCINKHELLQIINSGFAIVSSKDL
jgi:hypothetical protein